MPNLNILSSVRVGSGVTKEYLKSHDAVEKTREYEKAIQNSMEYLKDKQVIIAEGTGHPGVGSVIGLSNARVAKLLNAQIIYLVGGGIGKPLDELEVDLAYFLHKNCKVSGVLFNKILPNKVDMMKENLHSELINRLFPEWNNNLGIFGYIPQAKYLNNPSMSLVSSQFETIHQFNTDNSDLWHSTCGKVKIISLGYESFVADEHLNAQDIVVLGAGSNRRLKRVLDFDKTLGDERLGGLILTCSNENMPDSEAIQIIKESGLPVIAVRDNAGTADEKLYKCFRNTKIQIYDQKKHETIKDLFKEYFDTEYFLKQIGL
jgi:BioD-like phosphotransacetylase family protein